MKQVRGQNGDRPNQKAKNSQRLSGKTALPESGSHSLADKNLTPRHSRKRRKKGGWKALKGLRREQVEAVYLLRKLAAEAGTPLNRFVSIKPQDEALTTNDAVCKRYLSNKSKNVIQAVRGYGKHPRQKSVPAITIYEKRLGGGLHCHTLLHEAAGNDALERVADGIEIDCRPAHAKSVDYITKTRLPVGDARTEASNPHKRQGGQAAIKGARISFNRDAEALLAFDKAKRLSVPPTPPAIAAAAPVSGSVPAAAAAAFVQPEQLALPIDAPPVDVIALLENKRQTLHLPQHVVAHQLGGLKQAGYANWVRGHDRLSPWRRNRALEWLRAA